LTRPKPAPSGPSSPPPGDGRATATKKAKKSKKPASIRWALIPIIDWTDAAAVESARSELRELFDRALGFGRTVDSSKHPFGSAWRAIVEKDMATIREARANLFGAFSLEVIWAALRIAELTTKAHEFEINALGKRAKGRQQGKKGAEGRTAITERGVAELEAFFIKRDWDINILKTDDDHNTTKIKEAAKALGVDPRTIYRYVRVKFPAMTRKRRRAPSSAAPQKKFRHIVRKRR
jgi:hypothetical protein